MARLCCNWHAFLETEYGLACRFCKVWQGYPCNLWPWNQHNIELPEENEGSEAGIVKFQRKMKILGEAGRRREYLSGGTTARPGSNIMENVRFGRLGALPRTLATYAPSRPLLPDPPAPVPGPQNEGWQPTGPTYWAKAPSSALLVPTASVTGLCSMASNG